MRRSWQIVCVALLAATFAVDATAQKRKGSRPQRRPDKIKEGDVAPDFTLKTLDGKKQVTLSAFRDKKPVALVFGSYT